MSKKIIISESQYRRVFLGEQQLVNSKPPKYSSWSSHSIALGCGACSYDSYKKLALEKDGYALPEEEVKSGNYSVAFNPYEVTNNVFPKPMNTFEFAQSQWRKWGAQNPKTGRNKIPIDQIAALRKSWENAHKEWEAQNPTLEDLGTDITIYGDTEQGGIAQSMKASGYRFSDYGWTNAQQDSYRDESLRRIDDLIPYLDAVEYNANIDAQPKLIPQYCKKQTIYKRFYEYVCTTGDCGEVSTRRMNDLKKRQSKYDGMFSWTTPKGKKYGYYLVYRADIGKNPMQFCDNSSSKGVWVYKTEVGYHCGCYQQTNLQYMDDLGTWTENSYLGYIEKVKKHQKENAPGFLESVVDYFGGCFDDYHCILDLMSIAALAIPGIGVFVSTGLDVVNAAAYGVEAYNAKNVSERDASIVAGSLTLFGGLAGSFGKTNKLLKYGNANPKIYKYADDVYAKINKEFPDLVNAGKITNNTDKIKLNNIYSELAKKHSLKDSEILVAHDMLDLLKNVPKEQAKLYSEALTKIQSKIGKTELIDVFKTSKWKNALKKNNGDIVGTLSKSLKRPDTKALFSNVVSFVGVQEILEIPEVAKYVQKFVGNVKYMIKQTPRHLVESYGYPWEPTKMAFGAISTKDAEGKPNKEFTNAKSEKDNNLLKSAWISGWRPYSEEVENPTEKDFEYGWNWLKKPENEKYRTETFKKRLELSKGIDTNKNKSEEEIEIQKQEKIKDTSISSEEKNSIEDKNDKQLTDLFGEDIFKH